MTQVKEWSNKQLDVALAKLCGYEIYAEEFSVSHELVVRYEDPSAIKGLKFFSPCTDAAASLEVQTKAIEVSADKYVSNLDALVNPELIQEGWGNHEIARLLTASPREMAEAAYITFQEVKRLVD
ncbi:hypothetical protein [Paenibacillus sp. FSL R7-0333]|uniref:hypothetical protein n=1 Tax=Paenibacillus sp. FSL R7-0333 TaxID=1926587 RepID=UPI00096C3052|nr:hypothetical protein BK146_17000 [Paenibacillus sp. FSL R7-0333]